MGAARDFDAAVAHRKGDTFTLVGQEWPLPVELPHQAMLYLSALGEDKGPDAPLEYRDLCRLAELIWDEETVAGWHQAGAGVDRLTQLVEWAVRELTSPAPAVPTKEGDGSRP
jgi:hypothetical protein